MYHQKLRAESSPDASCFVEGFESEGFVVGLGSKGCVVVFKSEGFVVGLESESFVEGLESGVATADVRLGLVKPEDDCVTEVTLGRFS